MNRVFRAPRFDWGYLVVLGFSLPVLWPLVGQAYLSSHDGLHHLYRLLDLDWCIRGGALYPRWLPNMGFGYGYAILNYYAPLSYYIAEVFKVLGAGYIDSIKLTYALGFLTSGVTMYLFTREHLGRVPAILAGAVYVYLPYHLADGYVRGALAEFLAFPLLPLILWCFYKLIRQKRLQYIAWSALSLGGLIVTHNLMTLIFAPLLVAYIGFIWFEERDRRILGYAALALLLAFGLGAFYWLPGFVESKWARLGLVGPQATDYASTRLITITDFFSPFVIYRYFPEQGVQLQHPLSWLQFGLLCVSLAVPLRLWRSSRTQARRHVIFFLCATVVSLFMLFVYSRPLWDHVPLLSYLQYPWRFLTLTSFTSAFAIGSLPLLLLDRSPEQSEASSTARGRSMWGLAMIPVIVVAFMITALPGLPIEPQYLPEHEEPLTEGTVNFATMAEYDYLTGLWARLYPSAWLMEYLPTWVEAEPAELFLPVDKPPAEIEDLRPGDIPSISIVQHGPLFLELKAITAQPRTLSFHSYYVPNWGIYVDGHKQTPYPLGKMGLLAVDVPSGEHQIAVRFETTPAELGATIISLASLLLVLVLLVVTRQWRALATALVLCLLLGLATAWHVRSSPSVQQPTSVQANLGHQLKLLGYHADRSSYRPGDTINVTLYWLALQDMDQNYKVFVHLTDENVTHLVAQSDRWPVYNFSPTTRWEQGEIVWDRHEIPVPPGEPPGTYRLDAGAYLLETMQNLEVLDENGNPQGISVPLTAVQITP
jgi:hypothetical protein